MMGGEGKGCNSMEDGYEVMCINSSEENKNLHEAISNKARNGAL